MNSATNGEPSGVSVWTAASLVVGGMVGTGIFTSLGFQVATISSPFAILVLWVVGGVCALCGALCYSELAAAIPRSGGEYHFLSRIYHPAVGFVAGWVSVTVGFAGPVAVGSLAFAEYSSKVVPGGDPRIVATSLIVGVTLFHFWSLGMASAFQNLFTALKLGVLGLLIVAGFLAGQWQPISFAPGPEDVGAMLGGPFILSLYWVMYAYNGWNSPTYMMNEVRDAPRNVPLAMLFGTILVGALYLAVNAVFLLSAPMSEMAGKPEVAFVAAEWIFGPTGGRVMAAIISVALISLVSTNVWIGPRVAQTMGQDLRALRWLARSNPAGIPQAAMLLQSGLALTFLWARFESVVQYVQFTLQLCGMLTVLGVMVLRWREPDLPRPYRVWLYPWPPLIFFAASLLMTVYAVYLKPVESLAAFATMLLGLLVYAFSPRDRARPPQR
jgi:basic amino acid/polyamine antiporter, APA family